MSAAAQPLPGSELAAQGFADVAERQATYRCSTRLPVRDPSRERRQAAAATPLSNPEGRMYAPLRAEHGLDAQGL